MAAQADVIGFDEAGLAAAQHWLQLLHAQANKDPPKDLFSLFQRSATVLCPGCHATEHSETLDQICSV